jgi:hypothetical protein
MKQIETPKNAGLVLPTPFGTPSDKHTIWVSESAISNQRIKAWWLLHNISPNVGSCIFRESLVAAP